MVLLNEGEQENAGRERTKLLVNNRLRVKQGGAIVTNVKKLPKRTCIICRGKNPKRSMIRLAVVEGQVKLDLEARFNGRGIYICLSTGCGLSQLNAGKLSYSLKTIVTKENTASIKEQLRTLINE
ncbi:MAG: hypothetical protein CL880_00210 [Dehalococcoidia bacterium]|nr:hypothetical protein [Dehalococcoidia bacterium]